MQEHKQGNQEDKTQSEELPEIARITKSRHRKGTAERMWKPIKLRFNEDYRYVSKNLGLRFLYWFAVIVGMPFGYLVFKIKYHYKVYGKKNVRLLKGRSAITVANHVHDMDSPMLTYAFYPNFPYFVALKHNFEAFIIGGLARVLRGIPLPPDIKNLGRFYEQVSELLQKKRRRVHFYPEGEIEPYAKELREFKNGAFHMAVKNNVPVLPMVFVFPGGSTVRLVVGKPIDVCDVPGAMEVKEAKRALILSDYVKGVMQEMLDDYYGGKSIED